MKTSSGMVFTLMQSFDVLYFSLDVAALIEGKMYVVGQSKPARYRGQRGCCVGVRRVG